MNKIRLNDILHLSEEEYKNSKIELNMTDGPNEPPFLDKWLPLSDEIKSSGEGTECAYWPKSGGKNNFGIGQKVFSFIRKNGDEWLFISAGKILSIPENRRAKVEILEEYKPYFGRLIMKYKRKNAFSRYIFNLSTLNNEEEIIEILPCLYSGEKFEGYDKVHLGYSKLKDIFEGRIMPTYKEALSKITGVYCLTDTNNGKLYIGSATGGDGVAQRWGDYLSSKHGGNVKLKELHKKKGNEYFEKYFTFTILEYFGMSYDPDKIKKREQYWKECFDTIRNGYNDN